MQPETTPVPPQRPKRDRGVWCKVQQEWTGSHNFIDSDPKTLSRFFESCTITKMYAVRRLELCYFFRGLFGDKWVTHVRNNCGLDYLTFTQEFRQLVNPSHGFLVVELYARKLGFVSFMDGAAWKRYQAEVEKLVDANPFDEPEFDHRLNPRIRVSRTKFAKRNRSAYYTHPDVVALVKACLRPFNLADYSPRWSKDKRRPPAEETLGRGRKRRPKTADKPPV